MGAWGGAARHSSPSPWPELRLTGACLCSSEALDTSCATVPIHRAQLLAVGMLSFVGQGPLLCGLGGGGPSRSLHGSLG